MIVVPLLALLLYTQPGGSINCFYCPDGTLSSECTDTRNCTTMNSCKTTVLSPDVGFPFQGNEVVIRGCSLSENCIPSDEELGNSRVIFCCNIDLCNNRGINASVINLDENGAAARSSGTAGVILAGISMLLIVMWQ
ncbi:hypothetical protein GDO78_018026 [Eleutherodactylus coqui]|uniref:Snake toxin/toxin-like domain-containing protein n=1 Tax=Eleutherodactylus coqui TaxID=57060 RepID=A0A8J6B9E5_ELECQ|nr:hypothetical protein GDO78_018026 [Eleutherodactylus coqui]